MTTAAVLASGVKNMSAPPPTNDSGLIDRVVRQEQPYPIAAAWQRVLVARSDSDRIVAVHSATEVVLRALVAMLVPDYLRGPPNDAIDETLKHLEKPSLGVWLSLVQDLVRAIAERNGPSPFLAEAREWLFDERGKPTESLDLLRELVELRNRHAHDAPSWTGAGRSAVTREHVTRARRSLQLLAWLGKYRLLRAVEQEPTRSWAFRGTIQLLAGHALLTEPIPAEWTARLLPEAIYLTDAAGSGVLELSPLACILPEGGTDRMFLFKRVHRNGRIVVADDESGAEAVARTDQADATAVSLIGRRGSPALCQANEDRSRTIAHRVVEPEPLTSEALGGRYHVRGLLGEGGVAQVYRVWDPKSGEELALKLLREELAADPVFRERFKRAFRAIRSVRHPRVMSDVQLEELPGSGRMYLLMPLYTGGTLRERVEEGPQAPERVRRWAEQLFSALTALHAAHVIHRDVKPSNVLLDAQGDIVLADFDIARREGEVRLTHAAQQVGSTAYMAPEVQAGGNATAKSDVYSAALVIQELLEGRLERASPGATLAGPLGVLVRAAASARPEDRPTARAAVEMLRAAAGNEPSSPSGELYPWRGSLRTAETAEQVMPAEGTLAAGAVETDTHARGSPAPAPGSHIRRWLLASVAAAVAVGLVALWSARRDAAGPGGASQPTAPPPPTIRGVTELPDFAVKSDLLRELDALGVADLDAIWGLGEGDVLKGLRRVVPEAERAPPDDTLPLQSELLVMVPPVAHHSPQIRYGFYEGRLFRVYVRLFDAAPELWDALPLYFGRPADSTEDDPDGKRSRRWRVGRRVVQVRKNKTHTALVLADGEGFLRHREAWSSVAAAEKLRSQTYAALWSIPARPEEAIRVNEEALRLVPAFGDALTNLCHTYYSLGQIDKAHDKCTMAQQVSARPSVDGEAYYYLGLMAAISGQKAEAVRLLRKAEPLIPGGPDGWLLKTDQILELRLQGLLGNLNAAVVTRVRRDEVCYAARGFPKRVDVLPREFGFTSADHVARRAKELGVDLDDVESAARALCR